MAKMVLIDGKPYRMRHGKMVEIPIKWLAKITTTQTIRKRKSKFGQGRKFKRKVVR